MVQATKIRNGSVIIFNGDLCRIMNTAHHTPGNLRAMVQVKMRNLRTGSQFEHRFRANDDVEVAFLEKHDMEYLYDDGSRYHLMNTETFDQIDVEHEVLEEAMHYILPNTKVTMTFHEGKAIGVELPPTVDLKVTEADPAIKRQTATTSYKRAIVETGFAVMVPPFIEAGETIRINTETGEYQSRVEK